MYFHIELYYTKGTGFNVIWAIIKSVSKTEMFQKIFSNFRVRRGINKWHEIMNSGIQ
jgi:hypothetical protein